MALVLVCFVVSSSVLAQATRTWVSGVGDDANPGSRTAPCKTFAGAISKTAAGGEIDCLDPGGFGAVTITKSITIDGGGTFASILNSGTNGVIVNGPNIVVTLRNLSIHGAGTGLNGIRFLNGAVLNIENCVIANHAGKGIDVAPGQNAQLLITDTIIRGNNNNPNGGGIRIAPVGSFSVNASLTKVHLEGNLFGLLAEDRATVTVRNSVAAGNASQGFIAAGSTALVTINLESCVVTGNGSFGIRTTANANATVRLSNVTVVNNSTGLSSGGGPIVSFGNNRIAGNTTNGVPTSTTPQQ
jgi:hypothetical protein